MASGKWGGPTLQNVGSMNFSSYHFLKSRLIKPKIWGHLAAGNCKSCGHTQCFAEKLQGRALNASLKWKLIANESKTAVMVNL